MDKNQKRILLKAARDAIQSVVNNTASPAKPKSSDPALNEKCGCFVTIKNGRNLRGCIGQFTSQIPVIELVSEMAVAACSKDPRFFMDPVMPDELKFLEIEISILSPLRPAQHPERLRLGIDGIYITDGRHSGCFLPQVAKEMNWTETQFLSHCCLSKAGLEADAWKKPNVKVYLFTTESFLEEFSNI